MDDWLTLFATVAGGAAALLGTVLAHSLGSREERKRENVAERRDSYISYLIALDAAHSRLRQLADPDDPPPDLEVQVRRAMAESRVYETRERLLLVGNPPVMAPMERVHDRLAQLRKAISGGAKLFTLPYHEAYHPYAEALWHLRAAIRKDLGVPALSPSDLDKQSWDSQAHCDFCRRHKAAVPSQASGQASA